MLRFVIAFAGAAVLIAGCGGPDERDRATQVVREYLVAVANGDSGAACGLLTKSAARQLARLSTPRPRRRRTCRAALRVVAQESPDASRDAIRAAAVVGVAVNDRQASVSLFGASRPVRLRLHDGVWLISSLGG